MPKSLLKMVDVVKTFPGVKALDGVSLELNEGEVLGILGENGAGKSTLMNVLGGIYQPDGGKMYIDEKEVAFADAFESQNSGVAFIHQELNLEPHLTVAENVFLARELKSGIFVSRARMFEESRRYLEFVGLQVDPRSSVARLSTGQQQMVEIAKELSLNSKIIVMDEPTSSISENEVTVLFKTIRQLKERGVGVIYISHKMSEIFDITDRVMVMRDGQYIGTKITKETNTDELVYMMVGRKLENYYTRTFNPPGETALEVKNIKRGNLVQDVSFSVKRGEILGFYGLIGAGRSELMQAVLGIDPKDGGEVIINGRTIRDVKLSTMQKYGVVLVPENRKTQGLFLGNRVNFNITITVLKEFIRHLRVNKKKEAEIVDTQIRHLSIKTPSPMQQVKNLSGGNQQKVVLAKWLATNPKVLILDEPTKGVDVGAKSEIYSIMNDLAKSGIAIVMVSSELNEILNMCDRIIIMHGGKITGSLNRDDFAQEKILKYAIGE